MAAYIPTNLPGVLVSWLSANPFIGGLAPYAERVLLGPVEPIQDLGMHFRTSTDRSVQVKKGDYDLGAFGSTAAKIKAGACRESPILDGLSLPALNIVSPCHWMRSPQCVANWLALHARKDRELDRMAASTLVGIPAQPDTWYKLLYLPDVMGRGAVRDLVAAKEGVCVASVVFDHYYLLTCPAWHQSALHAGLPVEDLA